MKQDEISAILEPQEQVIWQDVVNRKVLFFSLVVILVITFVVSSFFFGEETFNYTSNGVPASTSGSNIGLLILAIGIGIALLNFFQNWMKVYVVTNKRVLLKSGIIGTDFNSIYFTQIKSANVSVGLFDKIFGVGTINIDTGKIETIQTGSGNNQRSSTQTAYDKLLHVSNPYDVYKNIQVTLTGREESLYSGRADRENLLGNKS